MSKGIGLPLPQWLGRDFITGIKRLQFCQTKYLPVGFLLSNSQSRCPPVGALTTFMSKLKVCYFRAPIHTEYPYRDYKKPNTVPPLPKILNSAYWNHLSCVRVCYDSWSGSGRQQSHNGNQYRHYQRTKVNPVFRWRVSHHDEAGTAWWQDYHTKTHHCQTRPKWNIIHGRLSPMIS